MPSTSLINRILRSLFADTPTELDSATENFSLLRIDSLGLTGPAERLIRELSVYYRSFGGPPSTSSLRQRLERLGELEPRYLVDELSAEEFSWGPSFQELVNHYKEQKSAEELRALLVESAQIISDGIQVRQAVKRGVSDAIIHTMQGLVKVQDSFDLTQRSLSNEEAAEYLRNEYTKRASQPTLAYGMPMGLTPLDEATKGGQLGELWIIGGFTCHPESQVFDFSTGKFRTLGEIEQTKIMPKVASWSEAFSQVIITEPKDVFHSSYKPVLSLMVDGKMQKVSPEHPFLTPGGWREAGQLEVGDWVARPHQVDFEGDKVDERLAELVGLLCGDGFSSKDQKVLGYLTSLSTDMHRFVNLVTGLGFVPGEVKYSSNRRLYYSRFLKDNIPPVLDHFLGKTADTKEIPSWLMKADRESLKALLRGLWLTDGWASCGKGGVDVAYSSNSEMLVTQIQMVLLRLGIPSRFLKPLKKTYNSRGVKVRSNKFSYRVKVKRCGLRTFFDLVHILKTQNVIDTLSKEKGMVPASLIDDSWFEDCGLKHRKQVILSSRTREQWKNRENHWYYHLKRARTSVSIDRFVLERALKHVPNSNLSEKLRLDWAQIESKHVSPILERMVDFSVPTTHNMLVDGCFQHNTSHGKSTLSINWMRHLAIMGGFNVMIYSLEMKKEQVWRILATSHSLHPKWGGRPPLDYEKIKSGTLSREDTDFYLNELLPDLRSNPEYGRIEIIQPTGKTTLDEIRARAEVSNRTHPLDVLVIDYIQLIGTDPKYRGSDRRQAVNEYIDSAKQMALEFDHGHGLLVVTPIQINRKGVKAAQENNGIYELDALADNNSAERSADGIITIYQDDPLRQKDEAVICNLKARDSRIVEPFNVYFPSRYRYIGDLIVTDRKMTLEDILEA